MQILKNVDSVSRLGYNSSDTYDVRRYKKRNLDVIVFTFHYTTNIVVEKASLEFFVFMSTQHYCDRFR